MAPQPYDPAPGSLAWLLDSSIRLPGGFRIGIDGLLGLIPGIGDLAGGVLSCYLLIKAIRMGVPKTILMNMALNIAVDTAVGCIPVAGDIFDVAWKANARNARLLGLYEADAKGAEQLSAQSNLGAVTAILFSCGLIIYAVIKSLQMFFQAIG